MHYLLPKNLMQCPKILVFKNEYSHIIINALDKMYPVFYNNNDYSLDWVSKNCINGKLYYIYDNVVYDYTVKDISEHFYMPHFALILNDEETEEMSNYSWCCILQMFNLEILKTTNFDVDCVRYAESIFKRIDILKSEQEYNNGVQVLKPDNVAPEYSFKMNVVENVAFYEVLRSNEKLPFVVVLDKYDGDNTRFFTHIYASKEWDSNRLECRHDFNFLCHVWKKLGMPGEFTMDIVNDYIKKCYPKDGIVLSEPVVYRTDIENVLKNYKSKKRGLVVPEFIVKKLNKLE